MRRIPTMQEQYSEAYLARLDAMVCTHGEPRGPRYCALCKRWLRHRARTTA